MPSVRAMAHRILIADGNEEFRRSLATILHEAGYSVAETATGTQALAQVKSCDLLITELATPDMDGLQVLTEIRRTDPDLPIIATLGTFSGRLLRSASIFRVPTLEKPFKRAVLIKTVESALSKKAWPAGL